MKRLKSETLNSSSEDNMCALLGVNVAHSEQQALSESLVLTVLCFHCVFFCFWFVGVLVWGGWRHFVEVSFAKKKKKKKKPFRISRAATQVLRCDEIVERKAEGERDLKIKKIGLRLGSRHGRLCC